MNYSPSAIFYSNYYHHQRLLEYFYFHESYKNYTNKFQDYWKHNVSNQNNKIVEKSQKNQDSNSNLIQEKQQIKINYSDPQKQNDKNYKTRIQKHNRNINSNILKHFIKYLQNQKSIPSLIHRIQQGWENQITPSYFLKTISLKFKKSKNYVKPALVRQICFGVNCKQSFSKIFRILLRRFLRALFTIRILNTPKIDYQMKLAQFNESRILIRKIFEP